MLLNSDNIYINSICYINSIYVAKTRHIFIEEQTASTASNIEKVQKLLTLPLCLSFQPQVYPLQELYKCYELFYITLTLLKNVEMQVEYPKSFHEVNIDKLLFLLFGRLLILLNKYYCKDRFIAGKATINGRCGRNRIA